MIGKKKGLDYRKDSLDIGDNCVLSVVAREDSGLYNSNSTTIPNFESALSNHTNILYFQQSLVPMKCYSINISVLTRCLADQLFLVWHPLSFIRNDRQFLP